MAIDMDESAERLSAYQQRFNWSEERDACIAAIVQQAVQPILEEY
jgi:hypothetical protein